MVSVVENVTRLIGEFTAIALGDPFSAFLLAVGSLLIALSVGVLGYLALGAAVDLVIPDTGRGPPRRVR